MIGRDKLHIGWRAQHGLREMDRPSVERLMLLWAKRWIDFNIFNVKSWRENQTSDSANTRPSFLKHESFQTMVSLAEMQICFIVFFIKTVSIFRIT